MARRRTTAADEGAPVRLARIAPVQQRSRERFERILGCAAEVMAEKGGEAFRMSDIVERTGVPFGSLYQYFPDKTAIIGTLAERYNAVGRECVAGDLAQVRSAQDLHPALCRIVDSYYDLFMREPVMRDIWRATQADRALQAMDEEDGLYLSGLLGETVRRIAPAAEAEVVDAFAQLIMTLIAAAVRQAITLDDAAARRFLALFKQMLPKDPPGEAA